MAKVDYYKTLGVKRDADAGEIKRAHRKLAKRYHPDRNKNDKAAEGKFKEVQEAYDVLSDPEQRRQYDRFGHVNFGPGGYQHAGPGGVHFRTGPGGAGGVEFDLGDLEGMFRGMGGDDIGSIFEQFSHQTRPRPRSRWKRRHEPKGGKDIEHRVSLGFRQAIHGTTLEVNLDRSRPGSQAGSETITLRIPPGVQPGQRIRVRGKGQPGQHGRPDGDMYIVCDIKPHPYFRRDGSDIHVDVPITIAEACLGAKVEVPTIDGATMVTIPPGTAGGRKLRLKGRGAMDAKTRQRGDHYVEIRIVPPPELSERQRTLLEEFQVGSDFDPRQGAGWDSADDD